MKMCVFSPLRGRAVSFREDHLIFVSHWGRLDGRQDSLITSDFCQLNEACRVSGVMGKNCDGKGRVIHSTTCQTNSKNQQKY